MTKELHSWENFSGIVKLFPLPNFVLFPHLMQPLHIFEPRYRQMTKEAVESDQILAMALLQPDWEDNYLGSPAIYPEVCVAKILTHDLLEDGRYDLIVRGLKRGKIITELESDKLYRSARIELLEETHLDNESLGGTFRQQMFSRVSAWLPNQKSFLEQLKTLVDNEISLAIFCDILAFALPFPVEFKQELLAELDVERRAIILLKRLKNLTSSLKKPPFPPEFSEN